MTIDGTNLSNLATKLNSAFSNFQINGTSAIKAYVNAQNGIWRSAKSVSMATEIKDCLDSAIKGLGTEAINIRDSIKTNVQNHNNTEGSNYSFSYEYQEADISSFSNIEPDWSGKTGLLEGHTISELKPYFNDIIKAFNDCFSDMLSAVNNSEVFSPTQQADLVEGITAVKNNFGKEVEDLNESWTIRSKGEDQVREEESSTASSNFRNLR